MGGKYKKPGKIVCKKVPGKWSRRNARKLEIRLESLGKKKRKLRQEISRKSRKEIGRNVYKKCSTEVRSF